MSVIGDRGDRGKRDRMVARLIERDGPYCFYCEINFDDSQRVRTLDHYTPQSMGGKTSFDNLRLACSRCNNEKMNLSGEEFLESPGLRQRREAARADRLKAEGIRPKGGYWHPKIVRVAAPGASVRLRCTVCGLESDKENPLFLTPCRLYGGAYEAERLEA